jgi:hypothetical protein
MSNVPAVSMEDLELEHAELLPDRETLWCCHPHSSGSSVVQYGYGNVANGGGGNINILNGSFDNILSIGSGNL